MAVMLKLTAEQYKTLPILANKSTCSGKTYVVTGSNSGLGLETARHLVEFEAACVVLAVRNLTAGENAKKDIEKMTGRGGVIQVWHIDMASYASVQAFAKKASTELDRIDGLVANAGIMVDVWEPAEGMESGIQVNVVNTVFLAAFMLPKLSEISRKFNIKPTVIFIVSVLGYTAKAEMDKNRNGDVLSNLNDQKRADMDQRYALTKLVEEFAVREFAALCPVERTGVVLTLVAPGLCSTGLGKDARTFTKIMHGGIKAMMARSAEVGSRTILHGLIAGEEAHGKLLSGCKIKEYWVPDWVSNAEGKQLQQRIWKGLADKLEKVQPGCISQLS
ncbi:short-chain dehydrogenase [Seiridium cupressi]